MKSEKISFTSRIDFIDRAAYLNCSSGRYVDFSNLRRSIIKAENFYTERIRTCSAGGLFNGNPDENLGFHIYDKVQCSAPISEIIDILFSRIKAPNRAFLLGGKDLAILAPDSLSRFKKLQEEFLKRVKNVTYFEEHAYPNSETNLCYQHTEDTWYVNSEFVEDVLGNKVNRTVNSIDRILHAFKKVHIADGDTLYINGHQVDTSTLKRKFIQ